MMGRWSELILGWGRVQGEGVKADRYIPLPFTLYPLPQPRSH
jgi:hypothetical protein